jgi:hypothetical protein
MSKAAFLSYNKFSSRLLDGLYKQGGREALVLQKGDYSQLRLLEYSLPELDHVVIYLGSLNIAKFLSLAAHVNPDKVILLCCPCALEEKQRHLHASGLQNARQIGCLCGGYEMRELYEKFMETGEI